MMYSTNRSISNMPLLWVDGSTTNLCYLELISFQFSLPNILCISFLSYSLKIAPKYLCLLIALSPPPSPPNLHHLEINSPWSFKIEHRDGQWGRCSLCRQTDPKSGGLCAVERKWSSEWESSCGHSKGNQPINSTTSMANGTQRIGMCLRFR